MAFRQQGVGAGEQEHGAVPEAHEVGHEGLLVGKHEPGDDDLQLSDHDQEGKPDETKGAGEIGDDERQAHQRKVNILSTKSRPAQILGQIGPDQVREKSFDPQKRNHHVGQANQEDRPKTPADDIGRQRGKPVGICSERVRLCPRHHENQQDDGHKIGKKLNQSLGQGTAIEPGAQGLQPEQPEMGVQIRHARPALPED